MPSLHRHYPVPSPSPLPVRVPPKVSRLTLECGELRRYSVEVETERDMLLSEVVYIQLNRSHIVSILHLFFIDVRI